MGSASSKFKKYLQHGDEYAAMQVFQSSPELRKHLDPNLSYGDNHQHNTALHYASKHGMKHLLRTFLNDLGGNPNKKNSSNETSLHMACNLAQQKSLSAQERRAACVSLLLQWRGVPLPSGDKEKMAIDSVDHQGNTALHCAAQSGLQRCVEILVAASAPLFFENIDKLTPCDLAMQFGHHEIAQFLETKMVFTDNSDTVNEDEVLRSKGLKGLKTSEEETNDQQSEENEEEEDEVYTGLRTQDLQEAKDQLLVETADMLHIPLFTAEALLRDNEWSREALLEKWMKEPVLCCQLAGVQPPPSALEHSSLVPAADDAALGSPPVVPSPIRKRERMPLPSEADFVCEICTCPMPIWDEPIQMSCEHQFCFSCWNRYLTLKIQEGDAHHIFCPAFNCHILVPVDIIEHVVSAEMARRYLQFDIKAFVETNRSIKWCPLPGCGRAVRLPPESYDNSLSSANNGPLSTSHAVDCGNGHFFCWECLGEAHAPCGCEQWKEWQKKISDIKLEELETSCSGSEEAANCLWLVTNSKPCPNCKSPIQKNEGCNHMKCSKCKFDFCWVCLETWKKHSSATGGYFRCNRFEIASRLDEKQGAMLNEAAQRNQQLQELTRFLHYYTRFRNHENSQRLELPLLSAVPHKMQLLAASLHKAQNPRPDSCSTLKSPKLQKGTKFIEEAVRELLKARRVLCGSYVYGYYLEDNGYNKAMFELMQNELEEVTEKLSEQVARPYLRTPRTAIMQTTALARKRRHEFVKAIDKGLAPPETPPEQRRNQVAQAIAKSWMKDVQGTHVLNSIFEWPRFETEQEETDVDQAIAVSIVGKCTRPNCDRPRARNPCTGTIYDFCSLNCSRTSTGLQHDAEITADVDLVIALEMSRLQMIEDQMKKQQREMREGLAGTSASSAISIPTVSTQKAEGDDSLLKLAIHLSLQENKSQKTPIVCSACVSSLRTPSPLSNDNSSSVDVTVDSFLKSLAACDLETFDATISRRWNARLVEDSDSTTICFQSHHRGGGMEDGRFEIGEIHENGGRFTEDDATASKVMRRSHSTGDLCTKPVAVPSCSYFDSDHSHHDDKPEELARRNLRQAASAEDDRPLDSSPSCMINFGGQSSIEDTSDSLNADMEVCGILGTTDDDSSRKDEEELLPPLPPKPRQDVFLTHKTLRIRICKSPKLETDSSNEYESETGIPKSPTLFISGVSISRTPEPMSPALAALAGRQSRSSSLTVPTANNSVSPDPNHSPKSPLLEPNSPRGSRSSSLVVPPNNMLSSTSTLSAGSSAPASPTSPSSPKQASSPTLHSPKGSKSASEPEREKEMFRFPKSSTDGNLSSVLLVQESNLSSDDFHEALFLEKSPKSSKRRKKSKKDRNRDLNAAAADSTTGNSSKLGTCLSTPVAERRAGKEASSVL
ncbi:ankyrin repeat and IBR domain-containing protein 1-like [Neocloeon triangulifer]|uniref:ankyrin repeat and IBR domain-containing protein 1-like n=1 Tax=Neocloeon triangulifer TaxID=2078957 RepID=UPI00286EE3EA|nr:ankyrin repeat and IBR domain-containing protein 1-like [Neocloeon triangulifer]